MGKRYLIHDRDPLFTDDFLRTLKDAGVESVRLPARSPNLNAHAERFVRSIKESCLERLILFGESSLRSAVQNFVSECARDLVRAGGDQEEKWADPGIGKSAKSAVCIRRHLRQDRPGFARRRLPRVPLAAGVERLACGRENVTAAWFYAACCQEYRWCRPPRRGMEITVEFALGFCSTGRRLGVSFSRAS
jgi:hypothetical protein